MDDIEEKRVYGDRAGGAELLVAAGIGLLSVSVSADRVGRFGVARRCEPADVAARGGRVAAATAEDVLVREPAGESFEASGFGPAVAVGFGDGVLFAAAPDGLVAGLEVEDGAAGPVGPGATWTERGRVDADVRAIDGRLLAAADGVYRLPGVTYAGLDDARDVAAAGPFAATGDGLYSLGNGWMDELDGDVRVVAAAPQTADLDARAHAVAADGVYERVGEAWRPVALPVDGEVADVAYGPAVYAVTADGDLLASTGDGWRVQALGVADVVGCSVA